MLFSKLSALVATVFVTAALSQTIATNFSDAQIQQTISNTTIGLRTSWCIGQKTVCGNLCAGTGGTKDGGNDCTADTLKFSCVCAGNDSSPALEYYQNTIPFDLCRYLGGDCLDKKSGDAAAQEECKKSFFCGNITSDKPLAAATTSAASSASPTATAAQTSSSKAAGAVIAVGEQFGSGLLGAGFLAILGYLL